MVSEEERASGLAERLGTDEAELTVKTASGKDNFKLDPSDYRSTLKLIISALTDKGLLETLPVAIGHRVVHGGESFTDPVLITKDVIAEIRQCIPLAPLHNPANLAGIEAIEEITVVSEINAANILNTAQTTN